MDPHSIVIDINNLFTYLTANAFVPFLHLFGINPQTAGQVVDTLGLFLSGIVTVIIITFSIISYIRGAQYHPFTVTYEDDTLIRGRAGTIMGILTIICSVWFLFSIVYIYFLS